MMHRDEDGLTLIELGLTIFLLAILALGVQSAALAVSRSVTGGGALLQRAGNFGRALELLSEDLRQPAASGILIGGAAYGTANAMTLAWTDRTTTPVTSYAVTYSIVAGTLQRAMTRTQGASSTSTTFVVARDLDPASAGGGAQFSRAIAAPGVVSVLLTLRSGGSAAPYGFIVEQRP